jgi:ABC-type transport system involved in cytochrome c biogenesis permease subunit
MGYLLFQITLFVYILSTAAYMVFFWSQRSDIRKIARFILIVGGVLHTIYFVVRYFMAGYTPLTNHHETISFFAWSLTWGYLSFHWRYNVKNFGSFVSPLITILMIIATFSSREITQLPPVLQSLWLPVHASIAIMAYVFYSRLPSLDALDNLNSHCLAVGFPLLTLGIITGTVWSKQTWGTYWQWDPKETWSLVTWFFYAALLHQRFTVGWRGRRAAIMAIVGFSAILFTLWGVTYLLGGTHTYVG